MHDPKVSLSHSRPVASVREYYSDLWGTNPHASQRAGLLRLRKRAGLVAAVAVLALAAQLAFGSPGAETSPAEVRQTAGQAVPQP